MFDFMQRLMPPIASSNASEADKWIAVETLEIMLIVLQKYFSHDFFPYLDEPTITSYADDIRYEKERLCQTKAIYTEAISQIEVIEPERDFGKSVLEVYNELTRRETIKLAGAEAAKYYPENRSLQEKWKNAIRQEAHDIYDRIKLLTQTVPLTKESLLTTLKESNQKCEEQYNRVKKQVDAFDLFNKKITEILNTGEMENKVTSEGITLDPDKDGLDILSVLPSSFALSTQLPINYLDRLLDSDFYKQLSAIAKTDTKTDAETLYQLLITYQNALSNQEAPRNDDKIKRERTDLLIGDLITLLNTDKNKGIHLRNIATAVHQYLGEVLTFLDSKKDPQNPDDINKRAEVIENTVLQTLIFNSYFSAPRGFFESIVNLLNKRHDQLEPSGREKMAYYVYGYYYQAISTPTLLSLDQEAAYHENIFEAAKVGNAPLLALLFLQICNRYTQDIDKERDELIEYLGEEMSHTISYLLTCYLLCVFDAIDNSPLDDPSFAKNLSSFLTEITFSLYAAYNIRLPQLCPWMSRTDCMKKLDAWQTAILKKHEVNEIISRNKKYGTVPAFNRGQSTYINMNQIRTKLKTDKDFLLKQKEYTRKELCNSMERLQKLYKKIIEQRKQERFDALLVYKEIFSDCFFATLDNKQKSKWDNDLTEVDYILTSSLLLIEATSQPDGMPHQEGTTLRLHRYCAETIFNTFIDAKTLGFKDDDTLLHIAAKSKKFGTVITCLLAGLTWETTDKHERTVKDAVTDLAPLFIRATELFFETGYNYSQLLALSFLNNYKEYSDNKFFLIDLIGYIMCSLNSPYDAKKKERKADRKERQETLNKKVKDSAVTFYDGPLNEQLEAEGAAVVLETFLTGILNGSKWREWITEVVKLIRKRKEKQYPVDYETSIGSEQALFREALSGFPQSEKKPAAETSASTQVVAKSSSLTKRPIFFQKRNSRGSLIDVSSEPSREPSVDDSSLISSPVIDIPKGSNAGGQKMGSSGSK